MLLEVFNCVCPLILFLQKGHDSLYSWISKNKPLGTNGPPRQKMTQDICMSYVGNGYV